MQILNSLLLFTTTALSAAVLRDASVHAAGYELLYSDLVSLDASVKDLTAAVTAYQNGTVEAAPIIAEVSHVNATNRKGYYDAKSDAVAVQNLNDSNTIVAYVADPIAVDITDGIKALNAKREPLVNSGLRQQILDGLTLLVNDHETFSAAVGDKLNPLALLGAAVPVAEIDAVIRGAIANFEA